MQSVNLTLALHSDAKSTVTVQVPDDFALARVPEKGRGSLACWLARLPNGSRMTAAGAAIVPWHDGYRRDVALVKQGGQWIEATEAKVAA
jgi:hypothetical protein